MATTLRTSRVVASLACSLLLGASALAADAPKAGFALQFHPVQSDVSIDTPEGDAVERCTIKAERFGKASGWVVRDPQGMILRRFLDTNADNKVDQWCYYKFGIEVYRDVDTNFNEKADQYRWLNTAGLRIGMDRNEDKRIDQWVNISAEEVTAELVAAIRDRDAARFALLLVNDRDVKALGLGEDKSEQLAKKVQTAPANFATLLKQQTVIKPTSKWVSFAASQPGVVPAGTDDSTADVLVYENAAAMVDTDDKPLAINVGTLVRTAGGWRLIDAPQVEDGDVAAAEGRNFFFAAPRGDRGDLAAMAEKPSDKAQELMEELQKLGDMSSSSTPAENAKRAELLEKLAAESSDPMMRSMWIRQLADMLSAAVQTGTYPDGIARLKALEAKLKQNPQDEELAFYAQFRWMSAEHTQVLADPNVDYAKIQTKWIEDLEAFVKDAKKYPDSADAMLELAISQEFAGQDEKALAWYDAIVKDFPESPVQAKARGAKTRLTSVGRSIPLHGALVNGSGTFDLAKLRGKAVLVQYWATWSPCEADLPLLKELRNKYKEFEVVGVNLDNSKEDMIAFLRTNNPGWPQLHEEGGLESRFATEMGIQTLPTMILIDKQGRVVDRNIRAQGLESELTKLLK